MEVVLPIESSLYAPLAIIETVPGARLVTTAVADGGLTLETEIDALLISLTASVIAANEPLCAMVRVDDCPIAENEIGMVAPGPLPLMVIGPGTPGCTRMIDAKPGGVLNPSHDAVAKIGVEMSAVADPRCASIALY